MGTSDRRPYLSASLVDQELLDQCQDNLTFRLEMIATIFYGAEQITLSDRNKYVGEKFYKARVEFPNIQRTLGDWLSTELEFSTLELKINNADGYFNRYHPGGYLYSGWVGKTVWVKIGIAEIESSYRLIFSGEVTEVSGFKRDNKSFTLICRSYFEKVNAQIPNQTFIKTDWPYLEEEIVGQFVPIIYGDWTTNLRPEAPEIPVFVVNGMDPLVNASLDPPNPNVGDEEVLGVIASVPLRYVDTASCFLKRGEKYYNFPSSAIAIVAGSDNTAIQITQKTIIVKDSEEDAGKDWIYESGDEFFIKCKGIPIYETPETTDSNIVCQCRDILKRFAGIDDSNFDGSWTYYQVKNNPSYPENAIANIKSRVWLQDERKIMEFVLSLLEQVRLEAYLDIDNKFSISSLHFEEFDPAPTQKIMNWNIVKGSCVPTLDDRNVFNRAKADYSYSPPKKENAYSTGIWKNQASITQMGNRAISKLITFPNLYIREDVERQVQQILKLAAHVEYIDVTVTPIAFLWELGQDITLNINIGGLVLEDYPQPVTGKIRSLNFDPNGASIILKIWSFQMVPFPGSLKEFVEGITGGSTAIITQE